MPVGLFNVAVEVGNALPLLAGYLCQVRCNSGFACSPLSACNSNFHHLPFTAPIARFSSSLIPLLIKIIPAIIAPKNPALAFPPGQPTRPQKGQTENGPNNADIPPHHARKRPTGLIHFFILESYVARPAVHLECISIPARPPELPFYFYCSDGAGIFT